LKKWMPRKWRAKLSPPTAAIVAIDSPDDTVATIASGRLSLSTFSKKTRLSASSSDTASNTMSASATAPARSSSYDPVRMKREMALDFANFSARRCPSIALSRVRARNVVSIPAAANTSPDPAPMAPLAPSTTTLRICRAMRPVLRAAPCLVNV
jgi:hypothetical protein